MVSRRYSVTTTKDDGVKVWGYRCTYKMCLNLSQEPHVHGGNLLVNYDKPANTPLISALDEADAVDGLCTVQVRLCQDRSDRHPSLCDHPLHTHADKLRGLK